MFCKKCGKQIKDGVQFCMYCGEKVILPGSAEPKRNTGKWILWIVVGILIVTAAVMGYFIWSGHFEKPVEDDEEMETVQDFVEESGQEPDNFEDEEEPASTEDSEEPEEPESAEEPEEEEAEEEVSQYFLPTSSSEYLTMSDLEGFSQDDCRVARNELYARHGRRFDDPNLQAYFDAFDWYEGTIAPADFDESVMNEYEMANRDLIIQYEKNMGYR